MKNKTYIILLICLVFLTFNACKEDCPEDTVINYPLYTEHKIFTNYDLGDSICFVSENLDTAKLFLVKMDTFTDQSISNTDIDCGTDKIYNTKQLRCFWNGNNILLNKVLVKSFKDNSIANEIEISGISYQKSLISGIYLPPPYFHPSNYDSIWLQNKFIYGLLYSDLGLVKVFNSNEGILKLNYFKKSWERIY